MGQVREDNAALTLTQHSKEQETSYQVNTGPMTYDMQGKKQLDSSEATPQMLTTAVQVCGVAALVGFFVWRRSQH